jgi:hypothetical protein
LNIHLESARRYPILVPAQSKSTSCRRPCREAGRRSREIQVSDSYAAAAALSKSRSEIKYRRSAGTRIHQCRRPVPINHAVIRIVRTSSEHHCDSEHKNHSKCFHNSPCLFCWLLLRECRNQNSECRFRFSLLHSEFSLLNFGAGTQTHSRHQPRLLDVVVVN